MSDTVAGLLAEIADVGTDRVRGGWSRPGWSTADRELREWFEAHARRRGLEVSTDRNGVVWAESEPGASDVVVTGSHLDSVPGGGAYDGPLGVASALVALDHLALRGGTGGRPVALAVFPEEEGSRFGLACLGSRLMTGAVDPARALALTDADGTTLAEACRRDGLDPERMGPDPERLGRMHAFVELHLEQGRALADLDRPFAVGSSVLGHGRWRVGITGQGNHAGTTLMTDRRDPLVAAARLVAEVRDVARRVRDARATVGRLQPVPGGTNVIASRVDLWVDVRHPDDTVTRMLVDDITAAAHRMAEEEGCAASVAEESWSPTVDFDAELRDTLATGLTDGVGDIPVLSTGAGHDAGVLKDHVPTAMLFVRNPTGVSHSPDEPCEDDDAEGGARALADALQLLARR